MHCGRIMSVSQSNGVGGFVCVRREVLASEAVLNIPTRADWKECKQSKEEEEESCKQLRDDFQPYDFTWDE